jgi:uncharacterized protein (TIGR01244 family)
MRKASLPPFLAFLVLSACLIPPAAAQSSQQSATATASPVPAVSPTPPLPGVRNFTRVDATLACGGALAEGAAVQLQQAGFKSVVNLRAAGEPGANIEAETKAAQDAGLRYLWLPFVVASPDATKVDAFLRAVADPANQPMLLHCASGVRASVFWAIKRVMVDGWPVEQAMGELPLSKGASEPLKAFMLDYLKQHGK